MAERGERFGAGGSSYLCMYMAFCMAPEDTVFVVIVLSNCELRMLLAKTTEVDAFLTVQVAQSRKHVKDLSRRPGPFSSFAADPPVGLISWGVMWRVKGSPFFARQPLLAPRQDPTLYRVVCTAC